MLGSSLLKELSKTACLNGESSTVDMLLLITLVNKKVFVCYTSQCLVLLPIFGSLIPNLVSDLVYHVTFLI